MTCKSLSQSDLQNLRIRYQLCELNDSIKPSSITTSPLPIPSQVLQPLDKSEALRPEIFQKLYVSPMKVHGFFIWLPFHLQVISTTIISPGWKTTRKKKQVHVSQNREIQESMFSCPPGCFTPHRNGQGHPQAERHLDPIGSGFQDQRYLKTCWDDGFSLRWRLGQACFV